MDLNTLWFILLGVLLMGYAILDGFDLGVGMLHLVAKTDKDRRIFMNSIGPIWDGNEVWLVTFGGALFAAFPEAYATIFSGYYVPFMLVLFCLIFRAVSLEFRSKQEHVWWRKFWDGAFFSSSFCVTFLFGVAIGSGVAGIPVGANKEFVGSLGNIVHPYSLLIGCLAVSLFALHGSIYLYLKTSGDLQERIQHWIWHTFGIFLAFYVFATIVTLVRIPQALLNFERFPWAWAVVLVHVLAIVFIPRAIYFKQAGYAFVASCVSIAALTCLFGLVLYPNIIHSSLGEAWHVSIYNAASSLKTLRNMSVIALLGMPFVLTYTVVIYWIFRGKVKLDPYSY